MEATEGNSEAMRERKKRKGKRCEKPKMARSRRENGREEKGEKEKELYRQRSRKRRTILGSLLWWVAEEFTSPCTPTIPF